MDDRSLSMKTIVDLKRIAKEENIKLPARANKAELVAILSSALRAKAQETIKTAENAPSGAEAAKPAPTEKKGEATVPVRRAAARPVPGAETGAAQKRPARRAEPEKAPQLPAAKAFQPSAGENVSPAKKIRAEAGKAQAAQPHREARPFAENSPAREVRPAAANRTLPENREAEVPAENREALMNPPERRTEAPQTPRTFQRPMSTQQRMGARTQPVQNNYRKPQQGGAPARFNTETNLSRPQRSFDPAAQLNRRFGGDSGRVPAQNQNGENAPRRAVTGDDLPYNDERTLNAGVPELLSGGECGEGAGILEIHPEGYGFLRAENYLPGNRDAYVSAAQIRRFNLRTGDYVVGKTRPQQAGDRSVGLIFINEINGQTPDSARNRKPFDALVPVYPDERLRMEPADRKDNSLRLIDVIAPIGKGQRGMIVSPPKAGKTTLLKKVANAITANNPEAHLIVLLIDERPEEVTDMKRSIQGEVVYSTFDEAPENHTRVSEMVLERAQRLVEMGKDVVILLDSITRLARAYNLVIPPTGRSLSGGLDPGALYRPKRFFGAARNIEGGGSLTIIATALVDTGSRMDDIIFEEFKGTGNMELHLDRSLSDRRIFPAIDMYKSGTRREELLLTKEELEGSYQVRRMLSKGSPQETAEQLILFMDKTKTNTEFFQKVRGWMAAFEKEDFGKRR